jgi:hypothetical protein
MTIHLPNELDFLLQEVALKAQINVSSIRSNSSWHLDPSSRKALMDAVLDEFTSEGLHANSEPNAKGLLLEDILDRLNGLNQSPTGGR